MRKDGAWCKRTLGWGWGLRRRAAGGAAAGARGARGPAPGPGSPDAPAIIVEHRSRLLADALDIFGIGFGDNALDRGQIGKRRRPDDRVAHRGPPQVGQSGSFGSLTR